MKKLLLSFALFASLLFSSIAMAAVYGPADAKFTVTPAAGWQESAMEGGVQLTNGKSALVIQVTGNGGLTLEAFGDAVISQAGLTDVKKNLDNDTLNIIGKKDGTELQMIISKGDEKHFATFTMAGPDNDAMSEMIGSIKDAE